MRKVFFVIFLAVFLAASPSAQMITSDILNIAHLTQLINQVYATYDNITATVEQVQNTYQQLENSIKMIENINFDDISNLDRFDGKDSLGKFLEFRKYYKDSLAAINRNMNILNDIEDAFTKKKFYFNGKGYTFGGLMGIGPGADRGTSFASLPKTITEFFVDNIEEGAAGYAGKLTDKQRQAIMSKYGLSPRNYYKFRMAEETASELIGKIFQKGTKESFEIVIKNAIDEGSALEEALKVADDSLVAQNKVAIMALDRLANYMIRLNNDVSEMASYFIHYNYIKDTEKEIEAQQRLEKDRMERSEKIFRDAVIILNGF